MATNAILIPAAKVKESRSDWPFSGWWTGELIRRGDLGCVRLGRRLFVTHEIIDAFIAKHTKVAP